MISVEEAVKHVKYVQLQIAQQHSLVGLVYFKDGGLFQKKKKRYG